MMKWMIEYYLSPESFLGRAESRDNSLGVRRGLPVAYIVYSTVLRSQL